MSIRILFHPTQKGVRFFSDAERDNTYLEARSFFLNQEMILLELDHGLGIFLDKLSYQRPLAASSNSSHDPQLSGVLPRLPLFALPPTPTPYF